MNDPGSARERRGAPLVVTATAVMALVISVLAIVVVSTSDTGVPVSTSTSSTPIAVTLSEFAIKPVALSAPAGNVKLTVTNSGAQVHDLSVVELDKMTPELLPGKTGTLDLGDVKPGVYKVICHIPGHEAAGMTATLTVGSGGGAAAIGGTAGAPPARSGAPAAVANPDDAKIDFNATADAAFTARDPRAPAPLPGTLHELTIEASENIMEVAPGVKQQMWTFNLAGQPPSAPGPTLRGKVGDTFRVTLINKGKVDHSIDFHASKVAWNNKMRSIRPGESLVYDFTANYAGAFMYHCGTAPALHHIGNGMVGAIIIDPPDLPPVDHEFVLVQGEIYTGPPDQPGDLTKMTNNAWDAVVFNGYVNQYKFKPIRVEPDQRVRVWIIDDGPSENSAFHIVGTVFDTVWKEGSYLLRPDQRRGGAQVLDLQPAQGGFVEFTLAEAGLYPIVTHKFSNVGKGALGLMQAGEVAPTPTPGH